MEDDKQGSKAYWVMLQRELGCDRCGKWKGQVGEVPCKNYDGMHWDLEGGCTDFAPKVPK